MTRDEFADMVRSLVEGGRISLLDATKLRQSFSLGKVAEASLALPWRNLPGRLTKNEFKEALRGAAVYLTPKQGQALIATEARPRITSTPPEVKEFLRERLRNHLRGDYERTMRHYAKGLSEGGHVGEWHAAMTREQRAYIARQMTAGLGRALATKEVDTVNQLSQQQQRFLQGFANEVSARRILGRDFSLGYLINRSLQYGGVGWATWFRGNEIVTGQGDGKVIQYIAIDDGNTCSPCRQAQEAGPYLPGAEGIPYPGEICQAHGLCRCQHKIVYDMDAWRRLKGLPSKTPEKPPETEREKVAQVKEERASSIRRSAQRAQESRFKTDAKVKADLEAKEAQERTIATKREAKLRADASKLGISPSLSLEEMERLIGEASKPGVKMFRPALFAQLDAHFKGIDLDLPSAKQSIGGAKPTAQAQELERLVVEYLSANQLESKTIASHGMTDAQRMEGAKVDGLELRWDDKAKPRAAQTIARMWLEDREGITIPQEVWSATDRLIFTSQRSADDAYWADAYGRPDFKSAASGGDGTVVVYNGRPISLSALAHEAGHNIAAKVYGKTDPGEVTAFKDGVWETIRTDFQSIIDEEPVSPYAKINLAEDFAESIRAYVMDKAGFASKAPKRFAVIDAILRGEGEASVRAAKPVGLDVASKLPFPPKMTPEEKKASKHLTHERWKEKRRLEKEALEAAAKAPITPPDVGALPGKMDKVLTPEEELREKRRLEHEREIEKKAAAAALEAKAKEDEEIAARAVAARIEVERAAMVEATAKLKVDEAGEDSRKAEIHKVSRHLTHIRWKAKRASDADRPAIERDIVEAEERLRMLRESPVEKKARVEAIEEEITRVEPEDEEKRLAEEERKASEAAAKIAEEAARLIREREAAERAVVEAAKAEVERIRDLEAIKAADATAKALAAGLPPKVLRAGATIKAEIAWIDAEVARIRTKRLRGEADTPDEKLFMDTRRKDKLDPLWVELGKSEAEDEALKKAVPVAAGVAPKKYRYALSLESEIAGIELEAERLTRKGFRGEALKPGEEDFVRRKDTDLRTLREELRLSIAEDKTRAKGPVVAVSKPARKAPEIPVKKLRTVGEMADALEAFRLEQKRLMEKVSGGDKLTAEEREWFTTRREILAALEDELARSRVEDEAIALATRRSAITTGTPNLTYRPPDDEINDLASRTADDLRRRGVDPDEALQVFRELIDNHPVVINTKSDILGFWKSGEERFKTQFETKTSMGANNNDLRARAELPGLGFPLKVNPRERPVYGFVNIPGNSAIHYSGRDGGLAWTVKDSVRERMTVTLGDSLYPMGSNGIMGTPILDPGLEGIGSSLTQGPFIDYMKSKKSSYDLDQLMSRISYIEWQCQGELPLSDMESVVDRGGTLSRADIKWLEDRGVKVTVTK